MLSNASSNIPVETKHTARLEQPENSESKLLMFKPIPTATQQRNTRTEKIMFYSYAVLRSMHLYYIDFGCNAMQVNPSMHPHEPAFMCNLVSSSC